MKSLSQFDRLLKIQNLTKTKSNNFNQLIQEIETILDTENIYKDNKFGVYEWFKLYAKLNISNL